MHQAHAPTYMNLHGTRHARRRNELSTVFLVLAVLPTQKCGKEALMGPGL